LPTTHRLTGLSVLTLKCSTSAAASDGLIVSAMPMTGVSPIDFCMLTRASPLMEVSQPTAAQTTPLP